MGQQERDLERRIPGFVTGLSNLSDQTSAFGDKLEGLAGQLLSSFRGLPSAADISGFMQGGNTPEQRALLDQRTKEITAGARGTFEQDISNLFDAAGGASRAMAGQAGLGGDFAGAPVREAMRTGARASAEFGRGALDVRAGIGQSIGQGMLTVNQAALGNLLGVGQQLLGARGQAGQLIGAASDVTERAVGRAGNFRLATGKTTQKTTEFDPVGTALQVGSMAMGGFGMAGAAGIGPFKGLMGPSSPGTGGAGSSSFVPSINFQAGPIGIGTRP